MIEQLVIVGMHSDPEPQHIALVFHGHCPVVEADTDGNVGSLDVSQIGTPPFLQILYGLLRQVFEPACGHILLELLIPLLSVERRKPGAQRRQVLRRELADSIFDVLHSTHRGIICLLRGCLPLSLEHMT